MARNATFLYTWKSARYSKACMLVVSAVFVAHFRRLGCFMIKSSQICSLLTAQFDFVQSSETVTLRFRAYALGLFIAYLS